MIIIIFLAIGASIGLMYLAWHIIPSTQKDKKNNDKS
tara:strand:- start:622 stop:732 length:111 start_codon:yes stop_codon:yes gene_type:complete